MTFPSPTPIRNPISTPASGSNVFLNESFANPELSKWTFGKSNASSAGVSINEGALRLTDATIDQGAFAVYNQAFAAQGGFTATFDLYAYGGHGADGISFFLLDGQQTGNQAGAFGGALGYASSVTHGQPGISGGYIGVGFDEYGNYSNPADSAIGGPGVSPDSIGLRGSQANGYKYLTGSSLVDQTGESVSLDVPGAQGNRGNAKRSVLVDLSATGLLNVFVDLNADGDFLDVSEQAIQNFNVVATNGSLPSTLKFGFAASTGGSTNIHEVDNLVVKTGSTATTPITPPIDPPINPPVTPPIDPPINPPVTPPIDPPINPPVTPPINPPVTPPIEGGGSLSVNISGSQFTYVENAAPASPVTITVAGSGVLNGATVQLVSGYSTTEDRLTIVGQTGTSGTFNGLAWNYNIANGTFTITGNGSAADYQTILQSVVYSNISDNPTGGDRTIRYIIANGGSNITTSTNFTVTAVDDAPVFTVPNNLAVLAGSPGATITSFTFTDADTPIAGYTFSVLNAQGQPDARFVIENGQLKLASTATLTATDLPVSVILQATTGGVAYRSTALTIGATNAGSFQIGGLGATTGITYLEGAAPVAIASTLTITGAGAAATINGGQVTVTGFVPGQDNLSIAGAAAGVATGTIAGTNITWTYAPTTGTITFTGAGTAANYQTAFSQVLYSNSSPNPSTGVRTFQYTVGTGATAGQATLPLTITSVNSAPTGVTFTPTTGPIGAGGILGTIVIQDLDSSTFTYTFGTPGQPNDTRFEIVTLANGTRQLKLKDGITLAAPVSLTIGVNDGGTPAGVFASQAFIISAGGVTITPIPQPDELIFDPATGKLTVWTLNNGNQLVAATVVAGAPTVAPGFRILKTGDFNNDGTSDVLWASATNQLQIWYLAPNGVFLGANPPKLNGQNLSIPAGFEFVGTADMNKDGNLDIVIQNGTTQTVQIWQLDGNGVVIGNPINVAGPVGDIDWRVVGFGDFDGDGDQDILFRNERLTAISVWQMNGTAFVGATGLGVAATATTPALLGFPALPAIYKFGAVGDFTNDGKADIVWRDNADNTILWTTSLTTNGAFTATQTSLPKLNNPANWRITGATDLNADGSADLLLSNPTADIQGVWLFKNGGQVALQDQQFIINQVPGTPGIGAPALVNSTTWQVAGVGEFGKVATV
jgi:hypothetical protein